MIELAIVQHSDKSESSRLIDLKNNKAFVFGCFAGKDSQLDLTYLILLDSYIDDKSDNMGKFMHRDKSNTVTIQKSFFVQGDNYFVSCNATTPDGKQAYAATVFYTDREISRMFEIETITMKQRRQIILVVLFDIIAVIFMLSTVIMDKKECMVF